MPSTYSANSVSFLGSGNVDVISTMPGAIVFSGSQSTHSHSTVPAAISASDHLYTSGTVVLSGGSNVTVSTNGQTIFFDAAATGGSGGGVAVSASDALFTSGTVVFSGLSNITISTSGTGTQQTVLISAPSPGAGAATAISGIVASDATYTSGTVSFVGSNAVTVKSGTGQQVIIDMTESTHAHSAFVLSDSNGLAWGTNASTVTGSYTQSTHAHSAYVFSNSNSITFGTAGSTVTASFSQSTHSHAADNSIAISASDALFTSGTVVFSGNGITVNTSGTGTQQTVGLLASTHAHSAFVFSNSNNVSFGTAGSTVTATASYSQSTGPAAISASNAAFTSGTVVFSGTQGITVNTSGTGTQQTIGISGHNHGAIIASNATFTSGTVVFTGGPNITVGTSGTGTQQTISFSAAAGAGGTSIAGIQASDATYTSGTVVFTGSNAITVRSTTGQAVVIDMTQSTHAHSAFVLSASNGLAWGTNASTVTGSYTQSTHAHSAFVFSNSNNVSFGTNASTVTATASYSQSTGPGGVVASNATFTSGTIVFSGGTNVTVNTSGTGTQQTIGFSAPNGPGTIFEISPTPRGPIQGGYSQQAVSTGQSLTVFPAVMPNMNARTFRFQASLVTTSFTNSSGSLSWGLAYYTRANSTALSSVSSTSWSSTFSASATTQMSNVSGARHWTGTMSWPLAPGEVYFAAYFQSSGAGTFSQNNYTISTTPEIGLAGAASAATEQYRFQFYGIRTNGTTAAFPSQIAASEMQYSGAAVSFPHFQLMGS